MIGRIVVRNVEGQTSARTEETVVRKKASLARTNVSASRKKSEMAFEVIRASGSTVTMEMMTVTMTSCRAAIFFEFEAITPAQVSSRVRCSKMYNSMIFMKNGGPRRNQRAGPPASTCRTVAEREPHLLARGLVTAHAAVSNLFNLGRLLVRAEHYRNLRTGAFAEWSKAVG
jgi:hypothetical protein